MACGDREDGVTLDSSTKGATKQMSIAEQALAISVSAGVPVLLWGSPGTGKTSVVRALGASLGWPVEVVVGSIREPTDFSGLPVVADGGVWLAPPSWAKRLADAEHGLLFLDELTTAPPAVQAAMLRIVLERVVGDLALPAGVRVVAAANPPEQAADGWELSPPLANRMVHLDWVVDAATVADGLAIGFPPPPAPGRHTRPDPVRLATARATVAAFLKVRPTLLLQVPATATLAGRGWPSPRSWEMVATLLGMCETAGADEDVRAALVTGAVGEGAGIEFLSWLANADLPDPEAVLADPDSFELPERSDRAFAVLTAVASVAISHGDPESWAAAWRVLAKATSAAPDVATLVAQSLASARPGGAVLPLEVLELMPVLRAAGLLPDQGSGSR
jgi:hypothetical protein